MSREVLLLVDALAREKHQETPTEIFVSPDAFDADAARPHDVS